LLSFLAVRQAVILKANPTLDLVKTAELDGSERKNCIKIYTQVRACNPLATAFHFPLPNAALDLSL
jgi:hypothetical protein